MIGTLEQARNQIDEARAEQAQNEAQIGRNFHEVAAIKRELKSIAYLGDLDKITQLSNRERAITLYTEGLEGRRPVVEKMINDADAALVIQEERASHWRSIVPRLAQELEPSAEIETQIRRAEGELATQKRLRDERQARIDDLNKRLPKISDQVEAGFMRGQANQLTQSIQEIDHSITHLENQLSIAIKRRTEKQAQLDQAKRQLDEILGTPEIAVAAAADAPNESSQRKRK